MSAHDHSHSRRTADGKPESPIDTTDWSIDEDNPARETPVNAGLADDGNPLDNTRSAPRNSEGPVAGMSTAEKLGDVGPIPGAPRDPAPPGIGPLSPAVAFMIVVVVVALGVAVLATVL